MRAVSSTPSPKDDSGKLEDAKDTGITDSGPQLDICPQCATKYNRAEDVMLLNPPEEQLNDLIVAMYKRRASEPVKAKGKKRKGAVATSDSVEPPTKKKNASGSPAPTINPNMASASRAVASSLAQEEAKRKANMSDAVKSLYGPKDGVKKKQTFMTMNTFTRVSCRHRLRRSSADETNQYA